MTKDRIDWLDPKQCDPPHRVTHRDRFRALVESLERDGWRTGEPACLGYRRETGRVQLVSGSHRWAACRVLRRRIPVAVVSERQAYAWWGTASWVGWLRQPPIVTNNSVKTKCLAG